MRLDPITSVLHKSC